jgi:hypothetical protein
MFKIAYFSMISVYPNVAPLLVFRNVPELFVALTFSDLVFFPVLNSIALLTFTGSSRLLP